MDRGKEKCETLKRIRTRIAEQYGLDYSPTECTHQGPCRGTCPVCDAELHDLQRQLNARGIKDIELWDGKLAWMEKMDEEEKMSSELQGDIAADYDEEKKEKRHELEGETILFGFKDEEDEGKEKEEEVYILEGYPITHYDEEKEKSLFRRFARWLQRTMGRKPRIKF